MIFYGHVKKRAMHQTNKAFVRYFGIGADDIRGIYQEASNGNQESAGSKIYKLKRNG
jgi:hypothetical protein